MRIALRTIAIASVFVVFSTVNAYACLTTHQVGIFDYRFEPKTTQASDDTDSIEWTNYGHDPDGHSATSNLKGPSAGSHYFDTGVLTMNSNSTFNLVDAGTFPYHCSVHPPMRGSVSVPVMVNPRNGTTATAFTVTWANIMVPTGFNADVQVKKPHSKKYVTLVNNQETTSISTMFTPDKGPGIYKFRARLQNGTADASKYSPSVSVEATAP